MKLPLFLLLLGVAFTLQAAVVIDEVTLKPKESSKSIDIEFVLAYHYDLESDSKTKDRHTCQLFNAKNKKMLTSKILEVKNYDLSRSMSIPYGKQKGVRELLIVCTSELHAKEIVSKTHLKLKPDAEELAAIAKAKEKERLEKEREFYKKNPPAITIKKLRMVGVKRITYRNAKKKDLLIEAASGNYILRKEDLSGITLEYICKDVQKSLEKIAKKPIKALHVVKKQRVKVEL